MCIIIQNGDLFIESISCADLSRLFSPVIHVCENLDKKEREFCGFGMSLLRKQSSLLYEVRVPNFVLKILPPAALRTPHCDHIFV